MVSHFALGFYSGLFGLYLGFIWALFEIYLGFIWALFGLYLACCCEIAYSWKIKESMAEIIQNTITFSLSTGRLSKKRQGNETPT